jgi:hypothetical protein
MGPAMLVLTAAFVLAQPVFTGTEIFPPEEFAARRSKIVAQIGDAVAVQGTTERPGEQPFRQNINFSTWSAQRNHARLR